ncbi:MAG: YggT family protein [Syntrophaceae bacterium]
MFVVANVLIGIGEVLHILLQIYMWIVIIGALLSWVNPDPYNPIVRFLYSATEPVFSWLRRSLPFLRIGGIDFSPIIIIVIIIFLDKALVTSLIEMGMRLKGGF